MAGKTEELRGKISTVRKKIVSLFCEQCSNGAQAKVLAESGVTACGQFIGENAKVLEQRGLHGSCAALQVLARTDCETAKSLVPKIVKYIEDREKIEANAQVDEESAKQKCKLDESNVIKISEALYALSFVEPGQSVTEGLVKRLAQQLTESMIEQKGWGYFVNEDGREHILPTAYAILGLAANGYGEADAAAKHLESVLKNRYSGDKTPIEGAEADIMIDVAGVYALTFRRRQNGRDRCDDGLRNVFNVMWKRVKAFLREDLEQNVQYLYEKRKACYVYVPWQFYLICLVMHYQFKRGFSGVSIQQKLIHILEVSEQDGFVFPNSGKMTAARTNAILYEMLSRIENTLEHKKLFALRYLMDSIVVLIRSKVVRCLAALVWLGITFWIVCAWTRAGEISDLGSEILGAAWVGILTIMLRRW